LGKRRLTLTIPLPPYSHPRNKWRQAIHRAALQAKGRRQIAYTSDDRLEVHVVLNLTPAAALIHDVDNRLKDVLDALQGRAGGPKNIHALKPIIPNDRQIFRVTVEKSARKDAKRPRGRIVVRKLQRRRPKRNRPA